MKRLLTLIAAMLWAGPAQAATSYKVSTTAGPVETVVSPFRGAQSDAEFYGLFQSEANPPFDLLPETLHLYLYEPDGTDEVKVGAIFNTNVDGAATVGGNFVGSLSGALDSARGGVEDEGSESFGWSGADPVDGAASVNGSFDLTWLPDYTDGFTFVNDRTTSWSVLLQPSRMTGIRQAVFLHGDPQAPQSLLLDMSGQAGVRITMAAVTSVPLPMSGALLLGAVGVIALRRGQAHRPD